MTPVPYATFCAGIAAILAGWRQVQRDDDDRSLATAGCDVRNGTAVGEWEDVRIVKQDGWEFLRILRRVRERVEDRSDERVDREGDMETIENNEGSPSYEDEEQALSDSDDEALPPPPLPPITSNAKPPLLITYDIVYSLNYLVPTLYLSVSNDNHDKRLPANIHSALPQIYATLTPSLFKPQLAAVGILGALSLTHHPVTDVPMCMVHPCRTAEGMELVLKGSMGLSKVGEMGDGKGLDRVPEKGEVEPGRTMLAWFGVIGAAVGLVVPREVAKVVGRNE